MFPAGLLPSGHNWSQQMQQYLFTSCSLANEVHSASARHVIPLVPMSTELSTIFAPTPVVWFAPIPVRVGCRWPVTPLELPFDSLVVESNPKVLAAVFSGLRCDKCLLLRVTDAHQVRRHSQASGACIVPALFVRRLHFVAWNPTRRPPIRAAWQWCGILIIMFEPRSSTKQSTPIRWAAMIAQLARHDLLIKVTAGKDVRQGPQANDWGNSHVIYQANGWR